VFATGMRPAGAVLSAEARGAFARTVAARFSNVALASVGAIVVTGTYGAVLHVASWQALAGDGYGRIILAKIALLIPLLALGYGNYRRCRPGAPPADLVPTVAAEAALVVIILALSAVLTGLALPHPAS
jgi:putative copper export protein